MIREENLSEAEGSFSELFLIMIYHKRFLANSFDCAQDMARNDT